MRPQLVTLVAVAIAVAAVAFAITRLASSTRSQPAAAEASLPAAPASYLGVYEAGTPHTYQSVAHFARATGKQPNLVGYYSGWRRAVRDIVRRDGPPARRRPDPADRSHLRLRLRRSRQAATTATCARSPTASGSLAIRSLSASGTR